jgi:hypothetical protein
MNTCMHAWIEWINNQVHLRSSASIAGDNVNCLYKRRLGQLPRERVLTAAIANEEDTQLGGRHVECEMCGGPKENTRLCCASVVQVCLLVGVVSLVHRKICVAVQKSIYLYQSSLPLSMSM